MNDYQSPAPTYEYVVTPETKPVSSAKAMLAIAAIFIALFAVAILGATAIVVLRGGTLPWQNNTRGAGADAPTFELSEIPEEFGTGLATTEIANQLTPSVVCINIYTRQSLSVYASGSGIILNEDGFIVTNAHVVEGAYSVSVMLSDGRELEAVVIGEDMRSDLAVVKVTADDLVPAVFGDSDNLQVGERAIAIGNAAGEFAGTVTQGIISGLNRQVTLEVTGGGTVTMNLVQTDAAINPGNSGGALVNRYGQIIGINSAKLETSIFEGIGFAIPITQAKPIIENLITYGYVKDRAVLGITVIPLTSGNGPANNLPSQGLYIDAIEPSSDLPNHDITVGDVLLEADGVELITTADLLDAIAAHKPGETISLKIYKHGSGTEITLDVLLLESTQ